MRSDTLPAPASSGVSTATKWVKIITAILGIITASGYLKSQYDTSVVEAARLHDDVLALKRDVTEIKRDVTNMAEVLGVKSAKGIAKGQP